MAIIAKANSHARSNSLPSQPDPLTLSIEDRLCRLRSSTEATTSSSPSTICQKLDILKDLHECVNNWLQLPLTQQAFAQEGAMVEEVVDGSLRLLEFCNNIKDVFSEFRSCVRDLETCIRRKNGQELSMSSDIDNYIRFKKIVKKMVCKFTSDIKRVQRCNKASLDTNSEQNVMLQEVEAVSLKVFESVLSYVCPNKLRSKSLFSKLVHSKRVSCEAEVEDDVCGIEKIDAILTSLSKQKACKSINVYKKDLVKLESSMKELEEGLDCVFRSLIKTRVSLLNTLNH